MKRLRFIAITVVIAGLSFGFGAATEYLSQDADWWQSVPSDSRVSVTQGMVAAYQSGWYRGNRP